MPDKNFVTVGLGELLWDMFPEGKQLGGAPANFAYMSRLLGDEGIVASRVGSDAFGRAAGRRLERLGLRTAHIQFDSDHPTGTVKVQVDPAGQPTFRIVEQVAWDFFAWTPEWRALADRADAVCFGSLAQRCPQSRSTIRAFLNALRPGATRVFDVNLRQAFYDADTLSESAKLANFPSWQNSWAFPLSMMSCARRIGSATSSD
jgi:fructokinase